MNNLPSPFRLPDEVICEIFRESCFSHDDLARFSLISHRFLSSVRRCLYSLVPVRLVEGTKTSGSDGEDWQLTIATWKLLETVRKNPEIAQAVEGYTLQCVIEDYQKTESDRPSGKLADEQRALSAFLRRSPRVKQIVLRNAWEEAWLYPIIAKKQPDLEYFNVQEILGVELSLLPERLPKLKSLRIMSVGGPLPSGSSSAFQSLEHLQIYEPNIRLKHLSFLPSFSSTLRTLRINLAIVLALDFSQYPSLQSLHVCSFFPNSDDNLDELFARFSSSLSKSPSLRSLSFECDTFGNDRDDRLFSRGSKETKTAVLQTLDTIRIEEQLDLERLLTILSWGLTGNVRRIIVSTWLNDDRYGTDKINAVRGICEGRGIELVYQNDDRLFEWT